MEVDTMVFPQIHLFTRTQFLCFKVMDKSFLVIMIFIMKSVSHFRDFVFSFAITFAKVL